MPPPFQHHQGKIFFPGAEGPISGGGKCTSPGEDAPSAPSPGPSGGNFFFCIITQEKVLVHHTSTKSLGNHNISSSRTVRCPSEQKITKKNFGQNLKKTSAYSQGVFRPKKFLVHFFIEMDRTTCNSHFSVQKKFWNPILTVQTGL